MVANTPRSISFLIMSLAKNIELFGQILNGQTFGQCDLAEFARSLRLGLRPDEWRVEFLFGLPLVPLLAISVAVVPGPALLAR